MYAYLYCMFEMDIHTYTMYMYSILRDILFKTSMFIHNYVVRSSVHILQYVLVLVFDLGGRIMYIVWTSSVCRRPRV